MTSAALGSRSRPDPLRVGFRDQFQTPTFTVRRFTHPPNHCLPLHRHDLPGVVLALAGAFTSRFHHGDTYRCRGGGLFAVPAAESHAESIGGAGADSLIVTPLHPTATAIGIPGSVLGTRAVRDDPHTRTAALRARIELARPDTASGLQLDAVLLELLGRQESDDSDALPPWLLRVRERLDDEYSHRHTIASLAAAEHVSRSLLAREFRHHFGMTIGEYLRRRRLERAAVALRATDRSVLTVALDSGYYDQSHFTAAFRRLFGATPAAYRRLPLH